MCTLHTYIEGEVYFYVEDVITALVILLKQKEHLGGDEAKWTNILSFPGERYE